MLLNRDRAQRLMADFGYDGLVATSAGNVAYLSGFFFDAFKVSSTLQIYAVLPAGATARPALVMPSLEVDAWAEAGSWIDDIYVYGTFHRTPSAGPLLPIEARIVEQTREVRQQDSLGLSTK